MASRPRWLRAWPFALIKHDYAIAKAALRRLKRRSGDLLTVLFGLPLLAIVARAWLSGLPDDARGFVAYGISAVIAMVLANFLLERVWYHRSDGALAHRAQDLGAQLGYALPLLLAGVLVSFAVLAMLGTLHAESAMLGAGSGVASGLAFPFVRETVRRWWRNAMRGRGIDLLRHRNALAIGAALSAGIGAICAVLPQAGYPGAIVAGVYGLAVTLLTGRVDAAAVRYMTLMGRTAPTLLRHWLPLQLALLLPLAAVLLVAQSWAAAGVAAVLATALPVMTTLRILAYRLFSRLIADWMVAGLIAGTAYASLSVPPLGPAILLAAMIWLARRGADRRWLLI